MITHSEIIDRAGGYRPVAELLGEPVDRVRFWRFRNSIPAASWAAMATNEIATLEELAFAAAQADAANKVMPA
jgi:hypothetical protein